MYENVSHSLYFLFIVFTRREFLGSWIMVDKLFLSKWHNLVLWNVSLDISECFHYVLGNIASMSVAFCGT
jgi:hypothetical protein